MHWTWLPWRFMIRRVASAHGFLDPIGIINRLHRLAQPSEVVAPTELLRMSAVLHARGLMNSQTIQHNLDWVWPHWIQRQYDPDNVAFVPRAFSLTHINLTHRNWTAIGVPDVAELPLVDPRGLVTPLFDGWSLDGWLVTEDGTWVIPSRLPTVTQRLDLNGGLAVVTQAQVGALAVTSRAEVIRRAGRAWCRIAFHGRADTRGWLVVALRPYNPEGISFVHQVTERPNHRGWMIDGRRVAFSRAPQRMAGSDYRAGDVFRLLPNAAATRRIQCQAGLATAAALFPLADGMPASVRVMIPLTSLRQRVARPAPRSPTWAESLDGGCRLEIPDPQIQFLYDAAMRSLILHTPGDVFPGPFTYKRFWFRDAAYILEALLCAGFTARVERALDRYPSRQTATGYFRSQDGEWDANGEALWILHRFCQLTGQAPAPAWQGMIRRGADWIRRKRLPDDLDAPHAGLLPAGFSAEHLGPNDYYYWDDFWGVAGLRAAAGLMDACGRPEAAAAYRTEANAFLGRITRSLDLSAARLNSAAMPASPYRRLDPGAIGSLAAGYPLQLFAADDARLAATAQYLITHQLVQNAFFQDIGHSGMNPYLTLHIAQVLLRAGDGRFRALMHSVAAMASPTGQWPEAVHPRTHGGCMGDGQHVWASAEWVLMVRSCFVLEEADRLILGAGVPPAWLARSQPLRFGPTLTAFGPVSVTIERAGANDATVTWHGAWRGPAPRVEIRMPGFPPAVAEARQTTVTLTRGGLSCALS